MQAGDGLRVCLAANHPLLASLERENRLGLFFAVAAGDGFHLDLFDYDLNVLFVQVARGDVFRWIE